jgi:magnesium chelatase family protein
MEDGQVAIARVGRAAVFPSRFQLVAAMNPCPCGYAGGDDGKCRCPIGAIQRYGGRVSGPLRDRVDLWVQMPRVKPEEYVGSAAPECSEVVGRRVADARALQLARRGSTNSRLAGRALRSACRLGPPEQHHAIRLAQMEGWSARGLERLLRVARTIADLSGSEAVEMRHLEEAARFRTPGSRHELEAAV